MAIRTYDFFLSSLALATLTAATFAQEPALTPKPSNTTIAQVTTELNAADVDSVAQAVDQIRYWLQRKNVPITLWRTWLPTLMNFHRYQEAADLSILGAAGRPATDAIEPLLEFRVKALLGLNKPQEALQAAKSYYNVCQSKNMGNALDLMEQCLTAAYPDDHQIVFHFRGQQATASQAAFENGPAPATSILKSIKVDTQPYDAAIKSWSDRKGFADRVAYGNLLLAADHGDDSLALFRDLYLTAGTEADLTIATDGIVRSLRAEDGNVVRADAWLLALQQGGTASAAQPNH